MPYYLQCVTGELRTRAPTQAAKNEARERTKRQAEEDRAHVEGVLALANGSGGVSGGDGGNGGASNGGGDISTSGNQDNAGVRG